MDHFLDNEFLTGWDGAGWEFNTGLEKWGCNAELASLDATAFISAENAEIHEPFHEFQI